MKITTISLQAKNQNRVNISVDGNYRFSLDVYQVSELGIKKGHDYTEADIAKFETESQFGKLYSRALEYSLIRPRSIKELRDYLWRKTRTTKKQIISRGRVSPNAPPVKVVEVKGISQEIADRVLERLTEKGYVNDEKFARWWIDNRNQTKGTSLRKLQAELAAKGISQALISELIAVSSRNDTDEIKKIIAKKAVRYQDQQKLMQYLARQGFSYDDIKRAITDD